MSSSDDFRLASSSSGMPIELGTVEVDRRKPPSVPIQDWELEKIESTVSQVMSALQSGKYSKGHGDILLAALRKWPRFATWAHGQLAWLQSAVESDDSGNQAKILKWLEQSMVSTLREIRKEVDRGRLAGTVPQQSVDCHPETEPRVPAVYFSDSVDDVGLQIGIAMSSSDDFRLASSSSGMPIELGTVEVDRRKPPSVPIQDWELEKIESTVSQVMSALQSGKYSKGHGDILLAAIRKWPGFATWAQSQLAWLQSAVESDDSGNQAKILKWLEQSMVSTLREIRKEVDRGRLAGTVPQQSVDCHPETEPRVPAVYFSDSVDDVGLQIGIAMSLSEIDARIAASPHVHAFSQDTVHLDQNTKSNEKEKEEGRKRRLSKRTEEEEEIVKLGERGEEKLWRELETSQDTAQKGQEKEEESESKDIDEENIWSWDDTEGEGERDGTERRTNDQDNADKKLSTHRKEEEKKTQKIQRSERKDMDEEERMGNRGETLGRKEEQEGQQHNEKKEDREKDKDSQKKEKDEHGATEKENEQHERNEPLENEEVRVNKGERKAEEEFQLQEAIIIPVVNIGEEEARSHEQERQQDSEEEGSEVTDDRMSSGAEYEWESQVGEDLSEDHAKAMWHDEVERKEHEEERESVVAKGGERRVILFGETCTHVCDLKHTRGSGSCCHCWERAPRPNVVPLIIAQMVKRLGGSSGDSRGGHSLDFQPPAPGTGDWRLFCATCASDLPLAEKAMPQLRLPFGGVVVHKRYVDSGIELEKENEEEEFAMDILDVAISDSAWYHVCLASSCSGSCVSSWVLVQDGEDPQKQQDDADRGMQQK
eukprot:TRINITY_DN4260_c0_g1_i1.p1 TRINITY_DN4260_c0_g1~~TRINITY_DN4260_c0_g1_i1.p1  ORF type:complete len:835 (+),score=155.72 TRINITY_DN4260_c0_g1_i1:34-2505(+)